MAEVIREIGEQLLRTLAKPPSSAQPQKEVQELSQLGGGGENTQAQSEADAASDNAELVSQVCVRPLY